MTIYHFSLLLQRGLDIVARTRSLDEILRLGLHPTYTVVRSLEHILEKGNSIPEHHSYL